MKLYNTRTHQLEEFTPLAPNKIKMYVCGITPYDTTHLGHAFTYTFFDVLNRYLRYLQYDVTYTQNVTDINDRDNDILKRAKDQGTTWQDLAQFWTDKFLADMHELNWIMPENYIWASKSIPEIVNVIERLVHNKKAYVVNGGVYLDISKSAHFGQLSGFSAEKMLSVAKDFEEDIDNIDKKNQLDITLWRPTQKREPGHIPSFTSSYGLGRPGWHIECSAMAISSLGEQIDIHGGGIDLIYPHHESEIAQSVGATGKSPFANFWLHTNIVSYQGKKMSKSLGNLVMVSTLFEKYSPDAIRYMLLSHHYRSAWEYQESELAEAEERVKSIKQRLDSYSSSESSVSRSSNSTIQQFNNSMDDMNTPAALKIISEAENKEDIRTMAKILGFKF